MGQPGGRNVVAAQVQRLPSCQAFQIQEAGIGKFVFGQVKVLQMFEWHFVEELEQRNVTFDVYDHVCGGYFFRLVASIYAQWHFTR